MFKCLIKYYNNYFKTLRFIKLISYIIANKVYKEIQESNDEILLKFKKYRKYKYYYGTEVILGKIFKLLPIILISLLFNMLMQMIVMILSFMALRIYIGGLHFDNYAICSYISILVFTITSLFAKYLLLNQTISIIIFMLVFILIILYAPVEHPNRPINENEKVKFKRISMFILCLLFIIAHCAHYTMNTNPTISNSITYGVMLAGLISTPILNKVR